jgi:hypothetical protein
METRSYQPLGVCIYCHRAPPEVPVLTDEHILALSLGGYLILPKSSCTDCQETINEFESELTGKILLDIRTHLGVRTRRPKKRPKELYTTSGYVSIDQHPVYLTLPDFEHPEVLGLPKYFRPGWANMRLHTTSDTARRHDALDGAGITTYLNYGVLRKTLAKIAHGYAIAELGLSAFKPLLPDLILGKMLNDAGLVGAIPKENNKPERPSKHRDRLPHLYHTICLKRTRSTLGGIFLSCEISLFKPLGMPVYQIIVGTRLSRTLSSSEIISSFRQDL